MKTKLLSALSLFLLMSVTTISQTNTMWSLTRNGGAYGSGSIITMDPVNWNITVRHSFMPPQGFHPYGNLLQANDGNLYGTCFDGGQFASCTIFRFEPGSNTYTDVYDFDIVNGDFPTSGLIQGSNSKLYGVATSGGANWGGVLYEWDIPTSDYSIVHSFSSATGSYPYGAPILHSNGLIYGMTKQGGTGLEGVLYSYDLSQSLYTVLYNFGGINGSMPNGSLVEASDGKLYGMTPEGGANQNGILFSYDPGTSTFSKRADFAQSIGTLPMGSLIEASNGLLYGTASAGGVNSNGTVFSFDRTTNIITAIHHFDIMNGSGPIGDLFESSNYLYGTTFNGGVSYYGTAFRIELPGNIFTKLVDFNSSYGSNPTGAFMIYTPTGLPEVAENEISLFPNPVQTKLNIQLPGQLRSDIRLTIFDLSGKLVMEKQNLNATDGLIELELLLLKSGTYILELESTEVSYQQKFVKY